MYTDLSADESLHLSKVMNTVEKNEKLTCDISSYSV